MIKVKNIRGLSGIKLSGKVIKVIEEQLMILDDGYGIDRDIEKDLGGYVLILEDENDVKETKETILKGIIPEYTDYIECEGGKLYCLSLFILSSDYAVVLVSTKELVDILLED